MHAAESEPRYECKWCGDPSRAMFFCCHECREAWRDSPTRRDRFGEPKRLPVDR